MRAAHSWLASASCCWRPPQPVEGVGGKRAYGLRMSLPNRLCDSITLCASARPGTRSTLQMGLLFLRNQTVFGVFMGRKEDLRQIA